jgi:hypothetical protein
MNLFRAKVDVHQVSVEIDKLTGLSNKIEPVGIEWKYKSNSSKTLCRGQIHLSAGDIAPNTQIRNVVSNIITERHAIKWELNNKSWDMRINKFITFSVPLAQKAKNKYKSKLLEITLMGGSKTLSSPLKVNISAYANQGEVTENFNLKIKKEPNAQLLLNIKVERKDGESIDHSPANLTSEIPTEMSAGTDTGTEVERIEIDALSMELASPLGKNDSRNMSLDFDEEKLEQIANNTTKKIIIEGLETDDDFSEIENENIKSASTHSNHSEKEIKIPEKLTIEQKDSDKKLKRRMSIELVKQSGVEMISNYGKAERENVRLKEENEELRRQIEQLEIEREELIAKQTLVEELQQDANFEHFPDETYFKNLQIAVSQHLKTITELRESNEEKNAKIQELESYKQHSILQLHHLTRVVEDMEIELCDLRELVLVDETLLMRQKLAMYKEQVLDQKKQVKQTLERMDDDDNDDLTTLVRKRTMFLLDFYMQNLKADKDNEGAIHDERKEIGTRKHADSLADAITAFLLEKFKGPNFMGNHIWDFVEAARSGMKEGHQKFTRVLRGDELRCYYAISSIIIVTQNSPERRDDKNYKWKMFLLLAMKNSRLKEWLTFLLGFNQKTTNLYFATDAMIHQPKKRNIVNMCFSQVDKLSLKMILDPVIENTFSRFVERSREQVTTTPVTPN